MTDSTAHRASDARLLLRRCRRIVVKIGSKSLDTQAFSRLATEVSNVRTEGASRRERHVLIVSSGAIALGMVKLGLKSRPKDMPWLQAAAAAGQSVLMQRYEEAFRAAGLSVAQVLLTHADLADRTRANNARNALAALTEAGAIAIINENDAVSVDEIKFGDNDQLASMVTPLWDADLLILLSDVAGLLGSDRERVPFVERFAEVKALAGESRSGVGTGGMRSKLEAARRASYAGAHVVIAHAKEPDVIARVVGGEDIGTLFPAAKRIGARKHWIAYTLRPKGALVLDEGALNAVCTMSSSLLAVGVVGIRGTFAPNDPVSISDALGREVARGLVSLSAADAARLAGRKRGDGGETVVVHKDDLIVLPRD